MTALHTHARVDASGRLSVDVVTELPAGDVDVVLVVSPTRAGNGLPPYDFSGLAGELQWRGDAVAEQRGMRDEW